MRLAGQFTVRFSSNVRVAMGRLNATHLISCSSLNDTLNPSKSSLQSWASRPQRGYLDLRIGKGYRGAPPARGRPECMRGHLRAVSLNPLPGSHLGMWRRKEKSRWQRVEEKGT